MDKKMKEQFTIRFNPALPLHRQAMEYINQFGRGMKAHVIANALDVYIRTQNPAAILNRDGQVPVIPDITKDLENNAFRKAEVKNSPVITEEKTLTPADESKWDNGQQKSVELPDTMDAEDFDMDDMSKIMASMQLM